MIEPKAWEKKKTPKGLFRLFLKPETGKYSRAVLKNLISGFTTIIASSRLYLKKMLDYL